MQPTTPTPRPKRLPKFEQSFAAGHGQFSIEPRARLDARYDEQGARGAGELRLLTKARYQQDKVAIEGQLSLGMSRNTGREWSLQRGGHQLSARASYERQELLMQARVFLGDHLKSGEVSVKDRQSGWSLGLSSEKRGEERVKNLGFCAVTKGDYRAKLTFSPTNRVSLVLEDA